MYEQMKSIKIKQNLKIFKNLKNLKKNLNNYEKPGKNYENLQQKFWEKI